MYENIYSENTIFKNVFVAKIIVKFSLLIFTIDIIK